tara:strand:+ start:95071 stop:96501 length:1431 start_codon:yes stop_codon:yes gene_type:complete
MPDEMNATPSLAELYQLGEQLELDRAVPLAQLRARDHAIGTQCEADSDADVMRLRTWLRAVRATSQVGAGAGRAAPRRWLTESSATVLLRAIALLMGFSAMATFLLASGRGLVNVFVFLALFVLFQSLMCLLSLVALLRFKRSDAPAVLPLNPSRLLVARLYPDPRYLRESAAALKLVALRYGQELGALFTLAAVVAFFAVLAFSDFTFVWGSTFGVSNAFVQSVVDTMAWPWASWLPAATVSADVVQASRFHPAQTDLEQANIALMRQWWPFLITSMFAYALLPRLLLWLVSRGLFRVTMIRSFLRHPGVESVLTRMKAPLVSTQGEHDAQRDHGGQVDETLRQPGVYLVSWAGALKAQELSDYAELAIVPRDNLVEAGLGSVSVDTQQGQVLNEARPQHLLIAVRSWEPPMADLYDFLLPLGNVSRCTLCLLPPPGRSVTDLQLREWRDFSRELPFPAVNVQALAAAITREAAQ